MDFKWSSEREVDTNAWMLSSCGIGFTKLSFWSKDKIQIYNDITIKESHTINILSYGRPQTELELPYTQFWLWSQRLEILWLFIARLHKACSPFTRLKSGVWWNMFHCLVECSFNSTQEVLYLRGHCSLFDKHPPQPATPPPTHSSNISTIYRMHYSNSPKLLRQHFQNPRTLQARRTRAAK